MQSRSRRVSRRCRPMATMVRPGGRGRFHATTAGGPSPDTRLSAPSGTSRHGRCARRRGVKPRSPWFADYCMYFHAQTQYSIYATLEASGGLSASNSSRTYPDHHR